MRVNKQRDAPIGQYRCIMHCLFHEKGKQMKGCAHWSIQVYSPVLTNGRTPSLVYLSHEIDTALYTPVLTNGRIPLFVYLSHEIDTAL